MQRSAEEKMGPSPRVPPFKVTPGNRKLTQIFRLHTTSCHCRDNNKGRFRSKSQIFPIPVYLTPPLRDYSWNFLTPFRLKQTRLMDLPEGKQSLTICEVVSTQYQHSTDGRTDRQTEMVCQYRA